MSTIVLTYKQHQLASSTKTSKPTRDLEELLRRAKMQVPEEQDPQPQPQPRLIHQAEWNAIQYPSDRHTKLKSEIPNDDYPKHDASVRAPVHTFPVDGSHPIVTCWNEVGSRVIKKLGVAGLKWAAVECFNRRQLDDESKGKDNTTVVITLPQLPARTKSLDDLLEEIHTLSDGLWVELLPGQISHHKTHRPWETSIPYKQRPSMGGSVGPLDMSGTGTLGGFVELCKEGLPNVPCGLTCEHVVRPHSDDVPPEANFYPIKPTDCKLPPLPMGHPSYGDHERAISYQNCIVNSCEEDKEFFGRKLEADPANSQVGKALESIQNKISRGNSAINLAKTADRKIGEVFATSGHSLFGSEPRHLDWALISLHPERVGTNEFTDQEERMSITSLADPVPGGRVRKTGNATGFTAAEVNTVQSFVAYKGTSHEMISREWVVVCAGYCPFAKPGDSGSFVVNNAGEVIGLYWGSKKALPIDCTHTLYFSPIKDVFAHIKEITGYEARLPKLTETEE